MPKNIRLGWKCLTVQTEVPLWANYHIHNTSFSPLFTNGTNKLECYIIWSWKRLPNALINVSYLRGSSAYLKWPWRFQLCTQLLDHTWDICEQKHSSLPYFLLLYRIDCLDKNLSRFKNVRWGTRLLKTLKI
jgi:hypothetical protein